MGGIQEWRNRRLFIYSFILALLLYSQLGRSVIWYATVYWKVCVLFVFDRSQSMRFRPCGLAGITETKCRGNFHLYVETIGVVVL